MLALESYCCSSADYHRYAPRQSSSNPDTSTHRPTLHTNKTSGMTQRHKKSSKKNDSWTRDIVGQEDLGGHEEESTAAREESNAVAHGKKIWPQLGRSRHKKPCLKTYAPRDAGKKTSQKRCP